MSGALVYIDYTTKKPLWVSSNDPLPVTVGGSGSGASQVQGNVASGATEAGSPILIGGDFNTTQPTVTNGQRVSAQALASGEIKVVSSVAPVGATRGQSLTVGFYNRVNSSSNANAIIGTALQHVANGQSGSVDPVYKPNVFKRIASSAASGNPDFLKASAGELVQFWGLCGAAAAYLQIYNKSSAPTIGTDTPILTFPIAANAVFSQSIPGGGAYFSTGIAFAFTTDAAGTTGSAAAAVTAVSILGA